MIAKIESYLKENLDDFVTIHSWPAKKIFPIYLRKNYCFYEMTILGTLCILIEIIDEMPSIDILKKHIKKVESLTNHQIIFFYKSITMYRRKSLIENKISFLIENEQMYLPFLGLDLQKSSQYAKKEVKHFTKSAQLAYLYFLYHKNDAINMTDFAKNMNFTNMRASRALNELYYANLITYEIGGKTGRSKSYMRISDPEYFIRGQIYIKSPIKEIVYVNTKPLGSLTAGLDALAELSMINPPGHLVIAIGKNQFDKGKKEIIMNKDLIKDSKLIEVQIWDYDPKLFSDKSHVDLLSLYASLKEENDERIEQALENILRGESWYMD